MRSFLVNTLSILNSLMAFAIIVGGGIYGWYLGGLFGHTQDSQYFGAFVGVVTGLVTAAMWCGAIATLIDIRETLVDIRDVLRKNRGPLSGPNRWLSEER